MKTLRGRSVLGLLLIVAGVLLLLQRLEILAIGDLIWSIVLAVGGLAFLLLFWANRQSWWMIIPGFALLGLAALIGIGEMAFEAADELGAAVFLAALGLAFWLTYAFQREHWWAIIPGGVLLTIASVVGLSTVLSGAGTGGIFFLGLGLTFGLLYLLPTTEGRMRWALIPAAVLVVLGLLLAAAFESALGLVWPIVLILLGLYLVGRFFWLRRAR
ncbi:MAG: hypothetical protein JW900_05685 [Anaerolineae bacterium]|nr:hypothetical protein [Anaerolineae bacterium]